MLTFVTLLAAASATVPTALAHGGVLSYSWSGQWYWGWQPYNSATGQTTIQRPWSTYNPIQDATLSTIACNDDGTSPSLQQTATVAAGTAITAYWNQIWPHAQGPMLTYLANCGGSTCSGVNANSLKWFKIDQAGLLSGTVYNGTWGSGQMINQNSSWTTTIPSTVPSGNYLIRFETIAIHSTPAQFYPECAQISITGSGSLAPTSAQLVSFPGAYSNSDPGIDIDIYSTAAQTQTTYVIPGPPLYGSSSSGSGTTASASTSTSVASHSSSSSTAAASSSSAAAAGTVAQYGQCGGTGYTGATSCIAPYTCTYSSAYYSQCL
ncbi:carbohydrate-binding module family 1 protein [Auriscalpium vulgare]|uniref:Carbohydrate-binding module family 1 protein n=1 Tax=Auriscalpium vulgare TaxID=40419 RepID=A0ACB8S4T3_9AGAM|nr:carbohydrate-binding module family 1 protein [Auriscalpium vulgare]